MRQRGFIAVLLLAAIVGVVASAAAFGFLELVHELQPWIYNDLPDALGFETRPDWWALPVLAIAGLLAALAIVKLPGIGGHIPANGLNPAPTQPIELPGVLCAALASIGLGVGARPGGAADRDGRRDRLSGHPPDPARRAARGPAADRRLRDVRRGLVPVRLAGDRRRADDRGVGDRRIAAAPRARSRAARRRDRLADLDRPRLVDRRRHERHRDRHRDAAGLRPARRSPTSSGRSRSPR